MRICGRVVVGSLIIVCAQREALSQASAAIKGAVYDSVHHAPVAGATVIAAARDGSVRTTTTDSHGRFQWTGLAAAAYTLSVDDARLDSARIEIPSTEVDAQSGGEFAASLATPSVATRVRRACGKSPSDTTLGAIIGAVTDAASERPISGATVALRWSDFSVDRGGKYSSATVTRGVRTDSTGHFRACGVPIMRGVELQAQVGSGNSGIVQDRIGEGGVLIRELMVGLATPSAAPAVARVEGTIRNVTGAAVTDGNVILVGTPRSARLNSDGHFALDSVPAGTQQIEVLAIGFYPERVSLNLAPGAHRDVAVRMETIAAVMDTLVVIAHANDPRYREFDQRRSQGFGTFITAADIAKRPVFSVSDLLLFGAHLNAHVTRDGSRVLVGHESRGISSLRVIDPFAGMAGPAAGGAGPQCPLLILNGAPVPSLDDIDHVPPSLVYGIEIYAYYEPVPARYQTFQVGTPGQPPPNCGAIIVWTR